MPSLNAYIRLTSSSKVINFKAVAIYSFRTASESQTVFPTRFCSATETIGKILGFLHTAFIILCYTISFIISVHVIKRMRRAKVLFSIFCNTQ